MRSNLVRNVLLAVGVVAVLAVVGPFVYINFISEEAPPPLSLDSPSTSAAPSGGTSATTVAASRGPLSSLDGTWTVSGGQAGYRVVEVLLGQDNTAVGRTTSVTGSATVSGSTVQAATVSVDLATVTSDDNRRDGQFRGSIMNTSQFPTATFTLRQPVTLQGLPAEGAEVRVTAPGELTLRGQTRPVTAELTARRTGDTIAVAGSMEIVFADYGIPDPSRPQLGISTRDRAIMEFRVDFVKSS